MYFELAIFQYGYHLTKTSVFYLQHFRISKPITKTECSHPTLCSEGWSQWRGKGCDFWIKYWLSPLLVQSAFLDSVKRNRSFNLILSSPKPEEPTAKTETDGKPVILCVALSSVKSARQSPAQPLLRTPEVSCWKCSPPAKIKWVDQIKEQ